MGLSRGLVAIREPRHGLFRPVLALVADAEMIELELLGGKGPPSSP